MTQRISEQQGRSAFGLDPTGYHAARPGYPEQVYTMLVAEGALAEGHRILEIGAGSGIATRRLLEHGATVTAVEPDMRFRAQLEALGDTFSPRLQVIEASFEEAALSAERFDLVVSATAYHWLDPRLRVAYIRRLVRRGGRVALWWNVFQDLHRPDPFHDATRDLLAALEASPSGAADEVPFALRREERIDELVRGGFVFDRYEETRWTLVLDAVGTARLYQTFAAIQRLSDERRAALLERLQDIANREFNGVVERPMTTPLYLFTAEATATTARPSR